MSRIEYTTEFICHQARNLVFQALCVAEDAASPEAHELATTVAHTAVHIVDHAVVEDFWQVAELADSAMRMCHQYAHEAGRDDVDVRGINNLADLTLVFPTRTELDEDDRAAGRLDHLPDEYPDPAEWLVSLLDDMKPTVVATGGGGIEADDDPPDDDSAGWDAMERGMMRGEIARLNSVVADLQEAIVGLIDELVERDDTPPEESPDPREPVTRRCSRCGEPGHNRRTCKAGVCAVCGTRGHIAFSCPTTFSFIQPAREEIADGS